MTMESDTESTPTALPLQDSRWHRKGHCNQSLGAEGKKDAHVAMSNALIRDMGERIIPTSSGLVIDLWLHLADVPLVKDFT